MLSAKSSSLLQLGVEAVPLHLLVAPKSALEAPHELGEGAFVVAQIASMAPAGPARSRLSTTGRSCIFAPPAETSCCFQPRMSMRGLAAAGDTRCETQMHATSYPLPW